MPVLGDRVTVSYFRTDLGGMPETVEGILGVELNSDGHAAGIVVESDGAATMIPAVDVWKVEKIDVQ